MPSTVSPASVHRLRANTRTSAMAAQTATMPRLGSTPAIRPTATPSSAECAMVSPKKAIRRHTTKAPSGAATTATPTPAARARQRKSSMACPGLNPGAGPGGARAALPVRSRPGAGWAHDVAVGRVLVVVVVVIDGEAGRQAGAEQGDVRGIAADR